MSILKRMGFITEKEEVTPKPKEKTIIVKQDLVNTTTELPVDDKFTEFFKSVIEKNNIKGPDYYEFTQAMKSMESQPLPENTKYTAIFAGFAAQGVTKQSLIDSGNFYITKLEEHAAGFEQSIVELTEKEVTSREKELQSIAKSNEEITAAIAQLNLKLNENATHSITLSAEKTVKEQEIANKRAMFHQSLNLFKNHIQNTIAKITQYVS